MRATKRRPGYHRIYGEKTKHAPEASVLTVTPLNGRVGRRDNAARFGSALCSELENAFFAFDGGLTFLVHHPVPSGVERVTFGSKG